MIDEEVQALLLRTLLKAYMKGIPSYQIQIWILRPAGTIQGCMPLATGVRFMLDDLILVPKWIIIPEAASLQPLASPACRLTLIALTQTCQPRKKLYEVEDELALILLFRHVLQPLLAPKNIISKTQ